MNNLGPSYVPVLDALEQKVGPKTTLLVRAVLESKYILSEFEAEVESLAITADHKVTLIQHMVEQVATNIATMCSLMNKNFKREIEPLVDDTMEKASQQKELLQ